MKVTLLGLLAVSALALSGCATTGSSGIARTDPLPKDEVDKQKIATVNQWAHQRGYGVQWVHLPYKARSLVAKDD